MQPRPISLSGLRPSRVSCPYALLLLGTLLALAAAPAIATDTTISTPVNGPIFVNSGDTLTITDGGSVSSDPGHVAVQVQGGTVNISGGSLSGTTAIYVRSGTANISGGSLTALNAPGFTAADVEIGGGTVTITGGSFSGQYGVYYFGGIVSISGSCLQLSGSGIGVLSGTLADGTPINTPFYGLHTTDLSNTPVPPLAFTNCPPSGATAVATCTPSGVGANVSFSSLTATGGCGTPTVSYNHQPGSFFAPGNTPVTATALDGTGSSTSCPFTVTVAYQWSGVLQPINADGSSVFKAGSTVPVIFQLTGPSACVTTLAATLSYSLASLGEAAPVNEAASTSAATTGNLFRYTGGQYQFNWSTKGLAAGAYLLQIDMGDGVSRTIKVGLR